MKAPEPSEVELADRAEMLRLQGWWRRQTDEDIRLSVYGAHIFLDAEGAD